MADDVFGIVGTLQAGAFRVVVPVAEGGFGVVYRAHHEGFRADVALKCLKIPFNLSSQQKQGFLEKFQSEGELLFRLSALIPAVVRPLHVGTIEGAKEGAFVPFIALEWLDGESLEALLGRRRSAGKPPLDLARAARLLGPAARALECAHRFPGPGGVVSVLHRDLKPENLFLSRAHGKESLKILDFGIGKVKSAATQIVGRVSNESGLSAFTPAYAAPEQWLPKRYGQTGTWTDVWGFALTMVEVLAGQAPFEGDVQALMGACLDPRVRPTPRVFGVALPDEVERAFERALALDPRDRYQDLGEFWEVVERAAGVRTDRIPAGAGPDLDSIPPAASGAHHSIPDLDLAAPLPPARAPGAASERMARASPPPALEAPPARGPSGAASSGAELVLLGNDVAANLAVQGGLPPSSRLEVATRQPLPAVRRRSPRVAAAPLVRVDSVAPSLSDVFARALPALKILLVASLIMIADMLYASLAEAPFTLGPARAFWLAGPLAVFGLFKLAASFLSE